MLLVNDSIIVLYNAGVGELSEDIHFIHKLLLFLLAHFAIVQFFTNKYLVVSLAPDLVDFTKATYKELVRENEYHFRGRIEFHSVLA